MTTAEEAAEEIQEIKTDTTTLDALIVVCANRSYFDLKDIEKIVTDLNDKGISQPEITDPLVQWTKDRQYVAAQKVQDAMLDLRNIVAPYPVLQPQEEPDAGTQDVLSSDSSDHD